ncbi:MAG: hypothetical protein EB127_08175 [Alphaproteobacteria bacterium]|nr:hypothetical protein [Alphaproteobacteria bacterium]
MNSTVQKLNSMVALPANTAKNALASLGFPQTPPPSNPWNTSLVWFSGFLIIFIALISMYYREIMNSVDNITASLNAWLTGNVVSPPEPPQDEFSEKRTGMSGVVDRLLPPGKEVFNVSKNDYTYYDAAPLCKALGAELATYDQVKEAWQKGADWCNYGWVKGQMAVYPTQDSTYQELQLGPAEQKGACGKPGLNGGFFDNPEMKFGVTCVGKRPKQSQHDATALMSGSEQPLTVSGIEFEKKVQRFKEDTETLGILPFNKSQWGS